MAGTLYARLGPIAVSGNAGQDFIFDFTVNRDGVSRLAPNTMRRTYSSVYATAPVTLSDHLPEEWKANNPVNIPIEFQIVGSGQREIDGEIRKLRKFMRKDQRTGEPPDLLFVMGRKQWSVRLHNMEIQPVLWNENVGEQRVKVSLTLRTIAVED